ncbi:MAG: putative immunity protein [Acidimicrobiales bacterium]
MVSPQTLRLDDRRLVAGWAAVCVGRVLPIYETAVPGDPRVRAAIEQARAFASGDLPVAVAIRRRGGGAGAAAREAPTPAATAAAYAAEQAAAIAHMGAHALIAAGYAVKASALAAGPDADDVARAEARRHVAAMGDAVAEALALLPPLGENAAGPLGPGRATSLHVGDAIRTIQASLVSRRRAPSGTNG